MDIVRVFTEMRLAIAFACTCLIIGAAGGGNTEPVKSHGAETKVVVNVDTSHAINHVNDKFLSFTIDSSSFRPDVHSFKFNFSSLKIHTLMKALSPAYLRIGGTTADSTLFNKPPNVMKALPPKSGLITKADIYNLLTLTRSTGTRLLFDLNLQLRFGLQWDPSDAIELLEFCSDMQFCNSIDWELGNEPDWYEPLRNNFMTLTPEQISSDFATLKRLLSIYDDCRSVAVVGPDVGRPTSTLGNQIFKGVANSSGGFLSGLTFHHYYFNGQNATYVNYINATHFSDLERIINAAKATVAKTQYPNASLWLGETSGAYNSGTRNVSDRFVSGFLWMEKLGLSAAMGLKVVMRQTLYGGFYALLDTDMDPNPDYWLSWLHKKLVGRLVFNVTLNGVGSPPTTRVYAHCTNLDGSSYGRGAVTVFALNVDPNLTTQLSFTHGLADQSIDVYLLEADGPDGMLSRWVQLNGQRLVMPSETSMPEAAPVKLPPGSQVRLPPLTLGYFVFPDAKIGLCMK